MRKLFAIALAAALLPGAAAAQKAPPVKNAPMQVMDAKDAPVSQAQAMTAAVAAVKSQLLAKDAKMWPAKSDGTGGGIPPASVRAAGALFNPTGGIKGTPVWVVGITSPNGKGTLRVLVSATSGQVLPGGGESASFSWGMDDWEHAPMFWRQGLNAEPPLEKGKATTAKH